MKRCLMMFVLLLSASLFAGSKGLPTFAVCNSASAVPRFDGLGFVNPSSRLVASFSPHHVASDQIFVVGKPISLRAKFIYGIKDLVDEDVEIYVDDCSGSLRNVGTFSTDENGMVEAALTAETLPQVGRFNVFFRVIGDNSWAKSTLTVVPANTHMVVFDVDGTLTTSDSELWHQILSHHYEPVMTIGANTAVNMRVQANYEIIYLTARPYMLADQTREWLFNHGFAAGTVVFTNSLKEAISDVERFKTDQLKGWLAQGLQLDAAYGNALTDVAAYENAQISKNQTFIVGPKGGAGGTVALGNSFLLHIGDLRKLAPVTQPFVR